MPGEGSLEGLCTLEISENPDDVEGYGSYLATLSLTETTMDLAGVWSVKVKTPNSIQPYTNEGLRVEVIGKVRSRYSIVIKFKVLYTIS